MNLTPDTSVAATEGDSESGLEVQLSPNALQEVHAKTNRSLVVFRKIAAPLMAAVSGWNYVSRDDKSRSVVENASKFAELVDATVQINREILNRLDAYNADENNRWLSAGATAEIMSSHYRTTSQPLTLGEARPILDALESAIHETLTEFAMEDPEDSQPRNSSLGHSLRALAPVASSIARFSFGRDAIDLLADVTKRLTTIALEITARLSDGDDSADLVNSSLYFTILGVAGEFYMESHFIEMDRLLEMTPDARKEYVRAHDRKIPLEPVWEALELRLGMLEAITSYIPLSGDSQPVPFTGGDE